MSGVIEAVDWNESAEELYARYRTLSETWRFANGSEPCGW